MKTESLTGHTIGLIIALTIQYLLGMDANLFINFPSTHDQSILWTFAWKQIPLTVHIILGILLCLGSLALLIRSLFFKDYLWIFGSIIGFIAVLLSGLSGQAFLTTQQNGYSFSMALLFIIAYFTYCYVVYATKRKATK